MNIYIQTLHEAGIPTSFSGRIDINHFIEIRRLAALVNFIANPTKETLLVAHIMCNQTTLTETYEIQQNKSFDDLITDRVFEDFRQLLNVASMPPLSLLEYIIYNEPKLVLGQVCTPLQYKTGLSILTTFLEQIRPIHFTSHKHMSNELNKMLDIGLNLEYEMTIEHNENAVRVMNLHKSKGLEAPVVFLDGDSSFKEDKLTSYIDRDKNGDEKVVYGLYKQNGYNQSIIYTPKELEQFRKTANRHENAEFIRLLYVAATRAKQLLFIGINTSDKNNGVYWRTFLGDEKLNELPNEQIKSRLSKGKWRWKSSTSIN